MSRLVGKPTMRFPNRSDTNRPVQAKKRASSLKFRIKVEEELHYPTSENKGADQLCGYSFADHTAKLICVFVFAYEDCWFSHEAAQILPVAVFFIRYDKNQAVQLQKLARALKLWILKEERLHWLLSGN